MHQFAVFPSSFGRNGFAPERSVLVARSRVEARLALDRVPQCDDATDQTAKNVPEDCIRHVFPFCRRCIVFNELLKVAVAHVLGEEVVSVVLPVILVVVIVEVGNRVSGVGDLPPDSRPMFDPFYDGVFIVPIVQWGSGSFLRSVASGRGHCLSLTSCSCWVGRTLPAFAFGLFLFLAFAFVLFSRFLAFAFGFLIHIVLHGDGIHKAQLWMLFDQLSWVVDNL